MKNLGIRDRLIRLAIAVALLLLAWWLKNWLILALGLFTLYEGLASWCILYHFLGISSCPLEKDHRK